MKKIIIVFVVLAVVSFGVVYFVLINKPAVLGSVTVAPKWLNQAQFAGMFVADDKGFYKDEGIDVSFQEFSFEANTLEDLLNGNVDFAITSAEEFLVFRSENKPIKALAAIYQQSPYVVASLKETGINSPADLAGKTLGSKGGKIEESLFYVLLMSTVGLGEEDANIKKVGFDKTEVGDLLSGDVDTIGLYQTDQLYFFDKKGVEYDVLYPERYGINLYNDILVAREDFIENNEDLVRGFVHATVEGWERALEEPGEAIDITMKYVTNDSYKNVDYERFILDRSIPLIRQNANQAIGIMNFAKWNSLYKTMNSRGILKNEFDINQIFTNEFLP